MFPPSLEEKEPGVYVRGNRPDHELDFLWNRERKKGLESDKFHLGFFLGGVVVGSLATLMVMFIFFSSSKMFHATEFAKPTIEEQLLSPTESTNTEPSKQATIPKPEKSEKTGFSFLFFGRTPSKAPTKLPPEVPETTSHTRSYEVKSGDTLSGIAYRMYGSSGDAYVRKIQRANNLQSIDSVQIGQKLIIPVEQ